MPKIKNIIIFLAIGAVFVLIYIFYLKASPATAPLVSSSETPVVSSGSTGDTNSSVTQDFLTLLLSVNNIKLDDAIFSDAAFTSLDGSNSITLTPDGTEGRVNPFAPLGTDVVAPVTPTPKAPVTP